jgi:integrase
MTPPDHENRPAVEARVLRHAARYHDKHGVSRRRLGLAVVLDWLERAEGATWQERWEHGGEITPDWLVAAGARTPTERTRATVALHTLILEGVIRPGYPWLFRTRQRRLYANLRLTVAGDAFATVLAGAPAVGASGGSVKQAELVLGRIVVHTGKRLAEITTADLLEYSAAIGATGRFASGLRVAHQLLRHAGYLADPPLSTGSAYRLTKPSVAQLVDRQGIVCTPIRDLLVMYLEERAAGMDYPSATQLTTRLAKMFWRDIERHHPGIDTIALPRAVIAAWKQRNEALPNGRPRKNFNELFMVVRSFYLDLLQWAVEDPDRWARYACPSPISAADMRAYRHVLLHRQARMHARTRTLGPLLPRFLADVRAHRAFARRLLTEVAACPDGGTFTLDGRAYRRLPSPRPESTRRFGSAPLRVQPVGAPDAPVTNCHDLEDAAFWTWAVVEVLRLTGVRSEELLELTHLSIHRYTMPDGQRVLLLQIAPSKRDRERVLPICPELSHVLAEIVARLRNRGGAVPVVQRFDPLEKTLSAPLPYLFQRNWRAQGAVMNPGTVGALLKRASSRAGLMDKDGTPLHFTPHDFRRLFATEAVNGGLPIHIAAKLLGHLDLNTTRGYVAVYPAEVTRHYRAHLARRRIVRPAAEYHEPTAAEWDAFGTHFRRRKMALGDCYRPYSTDCPHEHACVRCPMLRMDPQQLPRLVQIEVNTVALIDEAREHGWEGEEAGLMETLQHIAEKKAQVERIASVQSDNEDTGEILGSVAAS